MNSPEPPPAPQEVFLRTMLEIVAKFVGDSIAFLLALHFALQRLDKPWDGHQNRHAFALDGVREIRRAQGVDEHYGAGQQRRNEYTQHLPEHMAQRQKIQEPDGVEIS